MTAVHEALGVVVIGRNEGERLGRCLSSLQVTPECIVYVDSGSTDDSVALAEAMGIEVVALDMSIPFTAARARNAGLSVLSGRCPHLAYVQFVDGDCEVVPGWLEAAKFFIEKHLDVAAVCGRLRERFPERSLYNWLCDLEWNTPVGDSVACGGIVMMRVSAFVAMEGFNPALIAGEEPELCVRLRAAGWKIWRVDVEMALHDAAMLRFGQWWQRSVRAGHAFAEGVVMHGRSPVRHYVRESQRSWLWGGAIPLGVLLSVLLLGGLGLAGLLLYPLQVIRLARRGSLSPWQNCLQACFLVLGKFPELQGQLKYGWSRLRDRRVQLIEYK